MALILQVGEKHQHPKTPKNFPKCGPWQFTGYEKDRDDLKTCTNDALSVNPSSLLMLLGLVLIYLKPYVKNVVNTLS